MTGGYKVKKIYVGSRQVRPPKWKPLNPKCWYKFDGDYSDTTGTFGDASGTSTFQTLSSGVKVLQTDGTNLVLLPSGVTQNAMTIYTVTFWMKVITTSPTYGYYLGDEVQYGNTINSYGMSFYESTAGRNYFEWSGGYTSNFNTRDITPSGIGTGWRMVTLRSNGTGRANVSLTINATNTISTGATSGIDSSSIFGNGGQLAIGGRGTFPTGTSQRMSVQISNFVISDSYWDDAECLKCYNMNKSNYGL